MKYSHRILLPTLLLAALAGPVFSAEPRPSPVEAVPVTEEPLHVVRYRSPRFLIYTNWIEPGVWTLYHRHATDLLAVIPAATSVASQVPGAEPEGQRAPAGSVVFFPYSDGAKPYVHRVGARGDSPFINVGLDFQGPPAENCERQSGDWHHGQATEIASNRRGRAYRLSLPAGGELALPGTGGGLLLVPMGAMVLGIDGESWDASLGDHRFFESERPAGIKNNGQSAAQLIVFLAC